MSKHINQLDPYISEPKSKKKPYSSSSLQSQPQSQIQANGQIQAPSASSSAIRHVTSSKPKNTVIRSGAGGTWEDKSLADWDPNGFRLFVGNLGGEVSDEALSKAFRIYSSFQKGRVIRDKRTTKSKGFGFVSFAKSEDYLKAFKEMDGKYVGSHPVKLKRADNEIKSATVATKSSPYDKSKSKYAKK